MGLVDGSYYEHLIEVLFFFHGIPEFSPLAGQFDIPDYIMYEVSRVDHYREKAELLRFQQRIHDYLFDIGEF